MKRSVHYLVWTALLSVVCLCPKVYSQITAHEGDGVLNAPYRGTIDSLRECSADIGFGEVQSHVEPTSSGVFVSSSTIDVWVEGTWDRSVLRMYEGVDASGNEIDLTGTSSVSPHTVFTDGDDIKRFSFKAIGTKTLAPQIFTIRMSFILNGSQVNPTRTVTVAPITGSFCSLPGESEAFLPGTPILDVAVGAARLTVPVGRTAEMIGEAFNFRDRNTGASNIETNDVLFPGAAETVFIQAVEHFKLEIDELGPNKTDWGTPWPGYLVGFHVSSDVFGPEGTHYDAPSSGLNGFYRFNSIRPPRQNDANPANTQYIYDTFFPDGRPPIDLVIEIRDRADLADPPLPVNSITLTRNSEGIVEGITTSDGRSWEIESSPVGGWITSVTPSGGIGKRSYVYNPVGKVTQVKDGDGTLMYEFTYVNDSNGMPTILVDEKRRVDGELRIAVQHETVSGTLMQRKEYVAPGQFRQTDFIYDSANGLSHRLASMKVYENLNGNIPAHTTSYTHDVNNAAGTMVITQVGLPDGSTIAYEYDKHISTQSVDFGFRTKSTRIGPEDGSLVTYDVDYEFFYQDEERLFYRPRIVKQRDGRHNVPPANLNTEVTFDYDNGGVLINDFEELTEGQDLNRLLSITGPVINLGTSGQRTPRTKYIYDDEGGSPSFRLLRRETEYLSGVFRTSQYEYDPLSRISTETVDANGENIVTRYLYCDTDATQDRITVDPDGYWTRNQYDNDGRIKVTERFLNANAGNISTPCAEPTGPVYRTTNQYDVNGRLQLQIVENKDQDGATLPPPHAATITTSFDYDDIGRLVLRTIDPDGIGQELNYDYNWLGDIERQFDTSGRGTKREYDGRGLVETELPLGLGEAADANLTTIFTYDAMGNLRFADRPTTTQEERVYDDFDRLKHIKRVPIVGSGDATITTTFEYDRANNVTRTTLDESGTIHSDSTAKFDQGGFNYEFRQRTVAGTDSAADPLTQRKFDWAGNVIEEKSLGDSTVTDRIITTEYDNANRVHKIKDNLGGETTFARDDRGNVLDLTVKLDDLGNFAVTTTVYDALSRATQITSPEDGLSGRPDRIRRYDSRGNLLRESIRDANDVTKLTNVFGYDNAGRQTRQVVLASAASEILASAASVTTDRVTDSEYDADGRLRFGRTYNNNSATQLETITEYDDLGRLDQVTDPSGSYTHDDYATNGRLSRRVTFDGVGTRTLTFGYDGHDRIESETALGTPELVTLFTLDGLDRRTRITDPKGMATRMEFDLVGRRKTLVEDDGGALQRQTDFAYNRLSQLITQTAQNETSTGTPLASQLTTYRSDSLGRQTRIVYPDASIAQHDDPTACTDCVRQTFNLAGQLKQRIDQRNLLTTFDYDDRGLLLRRTTGTDRDTFAHDAVGRIILADRGTTINQDAVSHSAMDYTPLGDLDFETQTIAEGTPRTADYGYDQAGNRTQLTYPGGEVLTYTQTVLNQVHAVSLNGLSFLNYIYQGRLLDKRRTTTSAPGGNTVYEHDVGHDAHRRVNSIVNRFQPGGDDFQTLASYVFTHDNNGNPLTQTTIEAIDAFVVDDRVFTVDRLNRLASTEYFENGQFELTTLDLVGNREAHTDRAGTVTVYGTANSANEYPTIGGAAVTYDAAGNLAVDQNGRQYFYDELNRLRQIKDSLNVVLANYTYDALGRRVTFHDPVAGVTTRNYYDGQNVIEERNASDARQRYHVHGNQFIDERVATFNQATGQFVYYLTNANYSVAGMGNADGTVIDRLNYSATGDFVAGPLTPPGYYHDADEDTDIDLRDLASFQNCFDPTPPVAPSCAAAHDRDNSDVSDGDIDLGDWARAQGCIHGPYLAADYSCARPEPASGPVASGTFAMHGRPIDVLSDGFILQDFRARNYLPQLGRWLQRDPGGYVDERNLYESFGSNALVNLDPNGEELWVTADVTTTTYNSIPTWQVEYRVNRNGRDLGWGGLLFPAAVDSEVIGVEHFGFADDLTELRRVNSLAENQRQIFEELAIAGEDIPRLSSGIKLAVAAPVIIYTAGLAGQGAQLATSALSTGVPVTSSAGLSLALLNAPQVAIGTGAAIVGGSASTVLTGEAIVDVYPTQGSALSTVGQAGAQIGAFVYAAGVEARGGVPSRVRANINASRVARQASKFDKYVAIETQIRAPGSGARFGIAPSIDFRSTFFGANPSLRGQVIVHHAVEQQVLVRYPGLVSESQLHSLENLRGIPIRANASLHLSAIRREWNQFYRNNPNPTLHQLLQKATEIDRKFGSQFLPPVARGGGS